ncbi:MAG: hypothetical protein ACRCX2_07885 [Paraclostridium sp.]
MGFNYELIDRISSLNATHIERLKELSERKNGCIGMSCSDCPLYEIKHDLDNAYCSDMISVLPNVDLDNVNSYFYAGEAIKVLLEKAGVADVFWNL